MTNPRTEQTLQQHLTWIVMLTSLVSLVLASTLFVVYQIQVVQEEKLKNVHTLSQILAENIRVPLLFDAHEEATTLLQNFGYDTSVQAILIRDLSGKIFAAYHRASNSSDNFRIPPFDEEFAVIDEGKIRSLRFIWQKGRQIGSIYFISTLPHISEILLNNSVMGVLIFSLASLLAYWLGGMLQQRLTVPIRELATVAQEVSTHKDFAVRAQHRGTGEVGLLHDAFNGMLEEIQDQERKQRQAQAALEHSEQEYRLVTENLPALIMSLDAQYQFRIVNRAFADYFAMEPSAFIGKHIDQALGAEVVSVFRPYFAKVLTGHQVDFESVLPIKDAQRMWSVCCIPERDSAGIIQGFYALGEDVTDRKKTEHELTQYRAHLEFLVAKRTAELEYAMKESQAFSYTVSHDLRAPLRAIDGFSLSLLEEYGKEMGEDQNDYLLRIRSNCDKMHRLIEGLLALSRLSRQDLQKVPLSLTGLAQEVTASLQEQCADRSIEFTIEENVEVLGDPQYLRVVLENLFQNACKYTRDKKVAVIELGVQPESQYPTIVFIKDNGVGFEQRQASRLFEPFMRLHSATQFEGSGIGLATVARIIERHGGKVWAEGRINQGATFFFSLPQEDVEDRAVLVPVSADSAGN